MDEILHNFFGHIKKNKYLYGLPLAFVTVVILVNETLQFAQNVKEDFILQITSMSLFIFIYLIYIGGRFSEKK